MRVEFERDESGWYRSVLHRDDGVVLLFHAYDRKWRVPHDLAHFAVERTLRLDGGVFGSIAAGALFPNMDVLSGKLKHDAKRKSEQVLKANAKPLGISEVLAGVVHEAVEHRDRRELVARAHGAWGVFSTEPFPYPPEALTTAADALDELAARWTGRTLTVEWGGRREDSRREGSGRGVSRRAPSVGRQGPRRAARR